MGASGTRDSGINRPKAGLSRRKRDGWNVWQWQQFHDSLNPLLHSPPPPPPSLPLIPTPQPPPHPHSKNPPPPPRAYPPPPRPFYSRLQSNCIPKGVIIISTNWIVILESNHVIWRSTNSVYFNDFIIKTVCFFLRIRFYENMYNSLEWWWN